jgi:ankyrin repeat protein/formylmethanofuran dehydrogenase subunit D
MTGQIGRPGTGLHPLRGQNNVQGASDVGLIPIVYPDYQSVEDAEIQAKFEDFWGTKLDPKSGLTVVEIVNAIHDDVIKGMYIMGENPAMSDPDTTHAREALAKLDHLVVQDIFLTETAFHADVVLPASAWPEKDGTVTNSNRQVQMGRKALDLPGDTRQDWWLIQEIARRMGLDWSYTHPRDVFAEMRDCMDSIKGISWERLMAESSVTYPCDSEDAPGREVLFGDGFPTLSKRGKMVPADIIPPDEQPDDDYPMILTTGRQLEHWHTGAITRRASILDELEPESVACLSPADIARLGIAPGDKVRVTTRRGVIETIARRDGGVPKGVIFIPFCYADAAANTLTNPALDPGREWSEGPGRRRLAAPRPAMGEAMWPRLHVAIIFFLLPLAAGVASLDTQLLEAAAEGDLVLVEALLDYGADVDVTTPRGETALSLAARNNHPGVAMALIGKGADVDHRDSVRGNTALITAALGRGSLGVVRVLLSAGADVNAGADDGWTALLAASRSGDATVLAELLAAGADANGASHDGVTPLMIAAGDGFVEGVRILLAYRAETGASGAKRRTPLAWAAVSGEAEVIAVLLDHGARVDAADAEGNTPLMLAAMGDHQRAAARLLNGGADANARNPVNGNTALMLAANRGALGVVTSLVAAGADVNIRANDGWTALKAAEMIGEDDIVQHLRLAGARE